MTDKEIEDFWLDTKQSMVNFYKIYNYARPLNLWSQKLNKYQKKEEYCKIEESITKYLGLYAIDVMKSLDTYHFDILLTNIKRWKTLRNKYKFFKNPIKYENVIYLCIDIFKSCEKRLDTHNVFYSQIVKSFFQQIELFLMYEEYDKLFELSYSLSLPSIFDKIVEYKDIGEYVKEKHNIVLPPKIKGRKIYALLEKYY